MSDQLYIRLGLTVRGPYSLSDLHELANRGGFSQLHEVSNDKKVWTSASSCPELFPQVRRPQSLDRNKRHPDPADSGKNDQVRSESDPVEPVRRRHDQTPTEKADGRIPVDQRSSLAAGAAVAIRPLLPQSIWTVILGPIGFLLLLVCTVMIVLRLRTAAFAPASNIGLMIMLGTDLLIGIAAVVLGHLAIIQFQKLPGTIRERNLIVIGLSCGYTILILSLLFALVLLISALG